MSDSFKPFLQEYQTISQKLGDPNLVKDAKKYQAVSKRYNELKIIKETIEALKNSQKNIAENQKIIENPQEDPELVAIAQEENQKLTTQLKKLKQKFEFLTIPRDPDDSRNVILEIRAGAGGDEAGLFAAELFKMYSRWAENHNLKVNIYSTSKNDLGGIKEIIARLQGKDAYGSLKHESGVQRVQRIPETEKSGRIHTSTVTVAILPEAEETDLEIKPEEVKIDTFRSSGPGGQSVNTTDSAIRLTHLPTGLVVTCQDEKSQHKNKAKAFSILRSRILQAQKEEEQKKIASLRSSQIGSGDRSEKIRTYNFPQDRVTDHRLKKSWHGLEDILNGEIESILKSLKQKELENRKQNAQTNS